MLTCGWSIVTWTGPVAGNVERRSASHSSRDLPSGANDLLYAARYASTSRADHALTQALTAFSTAAVSLPVA